MQKEHDFSGTVFRVVQEATRRVEEKAGNEKKFDPVALGRKGWSKGWKSSC